jgi:hypothetical protein
MIRGFVLFQTSNRCIWAGCSKTAEMIPSRAKKKKYSGTMHKRGGSGAAAVLDPKPPSQTFTHLRRTLCLNKSEREFVKSLRLAINLPYYNLALLRL